MIDYEIILYETFSLIIDLLSDSEENLIYNIKELSIKIEIFINQE